MYSKKHIEEILLHQLLDEHYCPIAQHGDVDMRSLYRIARANKAEHVMFHVTSCDLCQAVTSKSITQKLNRLRFTLKVRPLLFEAERLRIEKILKEGHISALLFKHYPDRNRVGTDLDMLIAKENIDRFAQLCVKKGYIKTEKVAHKEIQLTNLKNRFKVDVHHLLAYPQYGTLHKEEYENIQRFTYDLISHHRDRKGGFIKISIEWFVLSRILHYWYNDMLCGLYPLYEILMFCRAHHEEMQWKTLLSLANKYSMGNESVFILSLAAKLFGLPSLLKINTKITIQLKLALASVTLSDIVFFPPISKWYFKPYQRVVQIKYLRYVILKLLINQHTTILRLIRPKILFYFLQNFFKPVY